MAEAIYILCALTSIGCALLLLSSYRATRARLLLWSSDCFVGLGLNTILLFIDLVVVPTVDLSLVRGVLALASIAFINVGLIWDAK
jgi:hypothetical protein